MNFRKSVWVAVALWIALSIGAVTPAGATYPGKNGKILVGGLRSTPTFEIQVYRAFTPDGLVAMQEAGDYAPQDAPEWSPSGGRFVATCDTPQGANLCLYKPDGTFIDALMGEDLDREVSSPTWQPNGKYIAYTGSNDGGAYSLFKVSTDGLGTIVPLTGSDDHQEFHPDWSPTGKWIAYTTTPPGGPIEVIYRVSPDGNHLDRLTQGEAFQPSWSPDGEWIAYSHLGDLYKMRADGTDKRRLIKTSTAGEADPVWSPNGKWIVFNRMTDTDLKLVKQNLVTGVRKTNTWPEEIDVATQPSWQATR